MFEREAQELVGERLDIAPAVCLLGARQVGKTTLALAVGDQRPSVYLDLESERDRARLADPIAYLERHSEKLVILDEVQHMPNLFMTLRGLIDAQRRAGRRAGHFLILGSASLALLQQSAESLAGRVSYVELPPLQTTEVDRDADERLWVRGGFPDSFLARNGAASMTWRRDFIRTYLERDIPQLGSRVPAETLRRFWTMLAHRQAAPLNAAAIARGLGVTGATIGKYLDLMVDLLLVRRLPPWRANIGKRLVKAPKIYVRDSGLTHALLNIADIESLLGHPIVGASYEAFVIETLINAAPDGTEASYFRTAAGAEIDLVLNLPNGARWAVEVKRSTAPKAARGFYSACDDIGATHKWVVYPGRERFPLRDSVLATPAHPLACELRTM